MAHHEAAQSASLYLPSFLILVLATVATFGYLSTVRRRKQVMEEVGTGGLQTQYVLNLYRAAVEKAGPGENAVLSPLSISLALAMVAAGAQGPTLQQMATCLDLPAGLMHKRSAHLKGHVLKADAKKHGLELSCANSIWVDQTVKLKSSFQKVLSSSYGAQAALVDFVHKAEEARGRVNKWAAEETHNKITEVLPQDAVTAATRMILANAIYFKGTWAVPFDETMTQDDDFYTPNGASIKVPTMYSLKSQYVKSFRSFKALRLPYHLHGDDTRAFSMIVLLPHDKNGLRDMEAKLDISELTSFGSKVPMRKFQLPKFKISFGTEVSDLLQGLGMKLLFGNGADLRNMTDSGEALCVSSVRQKAFVEVNEKGTEAAAVTAVVATRCCAISHEREEEFVADHPFMFLITEESTNTIIFTGRVTDPSKSD